MIMKMASTMQIIIAITKLTMQNVARVPYFDAILAIP
jgi:hypothetical protein